MNPLLPQLGRRGRQADCLADAVVLLTRAAFDRENPRELDVVTVTGIDGAAREVRRFPLAWSQRLLRAAEAGAFARMEVRAIVDRILSTPEPAAPQGELLQRDRRGEA